MPSYKPVTAAQRALEILRIVNSQKKSTIKSLHADSGLEKSTIIRMLETLIDSGYIRQDTDKKYYYVTGKVLLLSEGYSRHELASKISYPILENFRNTIGWPSDFAIPDCGNMIVVNTTRESGPLSYSRKAGYRAPMFGTSLGKAYIAFCNDHERQEAFFYMEKENQITTPADQKNILEQSSEIKAKGYAIMDDAYSKIEYNNMLWAIAVPVMSQKKIFGSLNIMMLRESMSTQEAINKYLSDLKATAELLAHELSKSGL